MRFQGLAVVLGKKRWPELIAHQRKKDFGLDAYASSSLTTERVGKGLAASITPTLKKISGDAERAKENFPDLKMLLFVTSAKVGNADRKQWEQKIGRDHGIELNILEREEIITLMMMPENASLCASFLNIISDTEPQIADLIERIRRAANTVIRAWAGKTKGCPLIELTSVRLDPNGAESADMLSLEQIDQALSQGRRIVLEGPAGRGKTTTLIQLAQRARTAGTAFIVDLPSWTSSRRRILEYIAGMPAFQAEGLTAVDLARVQQTEPFLLLLNGWNEIAESNSVQANDALRELERDFQSVGIIVATRTHHLTPPLPGALRLRLLPLRRAQRDTYLAARLGAKGSELCTRIDTDPSLDELTLTPFILSEVATLFEAGAEIPSTKIGILDQVVRLQEQRDEHRNALQTTPIFGQQPDYLKALAIEMTRRGAVELSEVDARSVVATVARELAIRGQIEAVGAPAVLATLTAHHVLERTDYPQGAFQFEHQQIQEYYSAVDLRARLFDLPDDDNGATSRFTADYVNYPAWAEPLRMIAETVAEQTVDGETDRRNISAGGKLVAMTLTVDLVFAGELAQLCGAAVWNEVGAVVGERFRTVYATRTGNFRQYAIAAMLATGSDDFSDIIVPLLSGQDQQIRLKTYRLWSEMQVSSLGSNWRAQVRGWSEEARVDFVSELLHNRVDGEIAAFAAEDDSLAVKKAAASGLKWTASDDALISFLESLDTQTFDDVVLNNADLLRTVLKPKVVAAMRKFIEHTSDPRARLRTAIDLIELGEVDLNGIVKDAIATLPSSDMYKQTNHYIKPALAYLHKTDPTWVSEWVATQITDNNLYWYESWLPFAADIPERLVEKYLQRLETENLKQTRLEGMNAVIAASADESLGARVFVGIRELRRKVDAEPSQRHEFERQVMKQLETVFRRLPCDVAAASILSSVTSADPLDIKAAAGLLSRVARSDMEPLRIADDDLKARLREYLKGNIDLVLLQDDFNGEMKADLASSIAQVGAPEDMSDLVTLIRADIDRMRRGRAARAAGDRGPLGNGSIMSYARWHIAAVMDLDSAGADQVLIDLLPEPEYSHEASVAMMRDFLPKSEHPFNRTSQHDMVWAAREGRTPLLGDEQRRTRFSAALTTEISRLREENQGGDLTTRLKVLAMVLAAIDGRGSAATVLDVIAMPGQWDQHIFLAAVNHLLKAGVVLPATTMFSHVNSVLERTEKWMDDSDANFLCRILALCPFVDDPAAVITKIRDVLGKRLLWGHNLCTLVRALGESRLDIAIDLLVEFAADTQTFKKCKDDFINAFAALNKPRTWELLLGFVDPDIQTLSPTGHHHQYDALVSRLVELAQRSPGAAARLLELCERDLPEFNRQILSKVMNCLGTPETMVANLSLLDDSRPSSVPRGIWDQFESAFIDRQSYGQTPNSFTLHARASNEMRVRLFRMAIEDAKRRKSAFILLGQIEEWRLEYGRPPGEPRHPDFTSGQSWPLDEPDLS